METYGTIPQNGNGVDRSVAEPTVGLDDSDLEKKSLLGSAPTQERVLSMFSLVAMVFFLVCGTFPGSYSLGFC
jgi:hypothetical protein